MYQRSRGCILAFTYRIGATFYDKTLHLHVQLFLNHSDVVSTRGGSEIHAEFSSNQRDGGCVVIVLPSFSAMSYSVTVVLIFWGLFCFLIMFSKQNTSYFHFSDVNCLPHAKAPTRYYVKVITCFTYVGICSRQCSTVFKVWKLAQYCKIDIMATTVNGSMT